MAQDKESIKLVSQNKKAFHDYFVEDTIEAGIELLGNEVKSIRNGNINLKDSWCGIENGQIFAYGIHISPYEKGNLFNKDPLRVRRLLLHKREILKLSVKVKQEGYTLVPLTVYFKGSRVKLKLGVCKGKKIYDKREDAARRSAKREIERAMKERNK